MPNVDMLIGNPGCLVYDAIVGRAGAIGPMVVCFTGNRVFGRLSDVRLGETASGRLFLGDPGKSKSPECRAQAIFVFRARGRCPSALLLEYQLFTLASNYTDDSTDNRGSSDSILTPQKSNQEHNYHSVSPRKKKCRLALAVSHGTVVAGLAGC
ncbi:hypothetical protein HBI14_019880 [Parastagonospora nodorum]|nr:hypothetical protein HBI14_019880 [Parastagonospora nodorum]